MAHAPDQDADTVMRLASAALVVLIVPLTAVPMTTKAAWAGCGGGSSSSTSVSPGLNGFLGQGNVAQDASDCGGSGDSSSSETTANDPTHLIAAGLDSLCVETAMNEGQDPFEFCGLDPNGQPPQLTPGLVATAFQHIPLPPSRLLIQPSNGRTLVNFATNFYTDNAPFDVPAFQLLGHTIELRVRPVTFAWHYGDGASEATSEPGAAYPDLQITHTYLRKGSVAPSLDTTYAATYRVDRSGPWRAVDGTVTVAGDPARLEVLTATPTLVGYARE